MTLVDGVPLNAVRACQWTCCAAADIHANDTGYAVIAQAFATSSSRHERAPARPRF